MKDELGRMIAPIVQEGRRNRGHVPPVAPSGTRRRITQAQPAALGRGPCKSPFSASHQHDEVRLGTHDLRPSRRCDGGNVCAAASRQPPNRKSAKDRTVRAMTLEGREIDIEQGALSALRARLRGPVIAAGDAGYEESRTVWNAMIDRKPALIARCLGVADVTACVQFAREFGLLLCIKGGGHNIGGLATADAAMMIDMSLMRGVWVDPQRKIAHAQGGCLLGDVDRETQLHGLATVLGFVSLTGVAGLTLGGGFGYLTRRWGWTSDNVVGMDVVTHDARLVRASDDENPDLFWGLRGGGGNFGVVTGIDYLLHEVGPEIVGGLVAWHATAAPDVLELYRTFAAQAPAELTLVALIRPAPPAPWLPKDVHGKPIVALLACYSGDPAEGERILAPIKTFGRPIGDVLVRRPYAQMQTLLDATQPKGRRYYWKSEYLPRIAPALCGKVIEHAAKITSPHSAVVLFQLDGALNRLEAGHSPVGNRDARYVFNVTAAWDGAADDAAQVEWVRNAWNDMKAFSTGGTYLNFLTEEEGPERTAAALGKGLERLASVKGKWDPHNVFRANRNVKPVRVASAAGGTSHR
jgi:FAD/FMN-containing dehydrogenase